MAFRAKSSTHLISGSCWLWVMAYSHSRSPRDAEPGPSPVAARQRRMPALPPDARGLRKAGVSPAMLQSCNGPQRRSAIQLLKGALFPSGAPSGMHEARKLPRKGVRECIGAISRHGKAPENASRENIATDGRPWTHHGEILPLPDVEDRISRASCHRRAPRNAPGHNLATAGRPRRTPHAPTAPVRPTAPNAPSSHATAPCTATLCVAVPPMFAPNAPALPTAPNAPAYTPAPPVAAPRRHAPYAALLPPLKK